VTLALLTFVCLPKQSVLFCLTVLLVLSLFLSGLFDQHYYQGRHFSFVQGGGQHFDRLPRKGQTMKKNCRQKHKIVSIFQNQGGGANASPPAH